MVAYTSVQIPKPNDEQDFERLCEIFCKSYFDDQEAHRLGAKGQKQYGIDIVAQKNGDVENIVGIQCKKLAEGKQLSEADVENEINKAIKYTPEIAIYYIFTSGANSVELTRICQRKSQELKKQTGRNLRIIFWGWEKLSEEVQKFPDVHRQFHPNYNPAIPLVEQKLDDVNTNVQDVAVQIAQQGSELSLISEKFDTNGLALDNEFNNQIDQLASFIENSEYEKAMELFVGLENRLPKDASGTIRYRVRANIGICKIQLGQNDDGARNLLEAYEFDQENSKAIANRTMGLLLLDDLENAKKFAEAELQKDQSNAALAGFYVQALTYDEAIVDLLKAIPKSLHSSPDVEFAMVNFLRSRGETEKWIAKSKELYKSFSDQPFIKQCYAEALITEALNQTNNGRKPFSESQINLVLEGFKLLRERWKEIEKLPKRKQVQESNIFANLVLAGHMAQKPPETQGLISEACEELLQEETVVVNICQFAINSEQADLLEKYLPLLEEGSAKFTFCYYQSLRNGDWPQIEKLWENGSGFVRKEDAEFFEVAAMSVPLQHNGDDNVSPEQIFNILPSEVSDPRSYIIALDLALQCNAEELHNQLLSASIQLTLTHEEIASRAMIARRCAEVGRWRDVINLLEAVISPSIDNEDTRLLATAFANTMPSHPAGRAFFDGLGKVQKSEIEYLEKAAIFHMNRGAYSTTEKLLRHAIDENSINEFRIHNLFIIALWRLGKFTDLDAHLTGQIADLVYSDPAEKVRLANLLVERGRQSEGMKLAYSALKEGRDHEKVQAGYTVMIFMNTIEDNSLNIFPRVHKVEPDAFVTLKDEDGREYQFLCSNDPSAEPAFLFGNIHLPQSNTEIANASVGKGMGETFELESTMGGGKTTWKIVGLSHKYQVAFEKIRDEFPARFPNSSIMGYAKVDEDNIEPFIEKTRADLKKRQSVISVYSENQIPFSWIAHMNQSDPISFVGYLLTQGADVFSNTGLPQELNEAFNLLKKSNAKTAVMDAFSVWTAAATGVIDIVKLVFPTLEIPQSELDVLKQYVEKACEQRAGQKSMGLIGDQLVWDEVTEEQVSAIVSFHKDALQKIEEELQTTIIEYPTEFSEIEDAAVSLISPNALDLHFGSFGEKIAICEDLLLRQIINSQLAGKSVWLQSVVMYAALSGLIDMDRYANATLELTKTGMKHVALSGSVIALIAKNDTSDDMKDFQFVSQFIGVENADIRSNAQATHDCLFLIWADETTKEKRQRATSYLLRALLRYRSEDWHMILAYLFHRTSHGGLKRYISNWVTGHFLPYEKFQEALEELFVPITLQGRI